MTLLGARDMVDTEWEWFFSPTEGRLFCKVLNRWLSYHPINDRLIRPVFSGQGNQVVHPPSLNVASLYHCGQTWVCSGHRIISTRNSNNVPVFPSFILQSSTPELRLLQIHQIYNIHNLAEGIRTGQAIAISDGSYKDGFGTAAMIIEVPDRNCRLAYHATVPGDEKDMSSYCSKLTGILATLLMVQKLCKYFSIQSGLLTLGCDGLSAPQQAPQNSLYIKPNMPSSDIISTIRKLRAESVVQWRFKHVAGHQDDHRALDQLDHWGQCTGKRLSSHHQNTT
jgi:hypothetical protein